MQSQQVSIDSIVADSEWNTRKDLGDLQGLKASIARSGVKQPIHVQQRGDEFFLVAGFRRFASAKDLELDEIPAIVSPEDASEAELLLVNMSENVNRESLNPMDEAEGAERLISAGVEEDEILDELGWSKQLLTRRLALLETSNIVKNALRENRVSVQQARSISDLPEDRQEKFVDKAHALTTRKLRDLVDQEIESISNDSIDDLIEEDEEDLDDFDPEEEDEFNQSEIAQSVVENFKDLLGGSVGTSAADELIAVRAIDFMALDIDDLVSLEQAVRRIITENDWIDSGEVFDKDNNPSPDASADEDWDDEEDFDEELSDSVDEEPDDDSEEFPRLVTGEEVSDEGEEPEGDDQEESVGSEDDIWEDELDEDWEDEEWEDDVVDDEEVDF